MPSEADPKAPAQRAAVAGQRGHVARLTDPEVSAQLDAEMAAMRARPALAKAFLLEVGIITPKTGKLTKRFGG